MGQKINPHGFRVGVIKDWDSRWYASNEKVGDLLVEDHKIRVYLKKRGCHHLPACGPSRRGHRQGRHADRGVSQER